MLFAIGMHSTANACTPKLEIDMPEIPDIELPDSTKDMISAGVENYFKKSAIAYIYYQVIAMRKGIRALLRADLIRLYNKYHDDYEYCPLYVKQSLEDEYKQYHTLKGNGVGTQMYHALMELPTEPQHEREE